MNRINLIYTLLHKRFGPQGWWPTTPKGYKGPVYNGGPKNEKEKLEVIFGAILTQNTSWKNVEKAIINLEKESLISTSKIKAIPHKRLAELIRPAGYFNQKAERLKIVAEFFDEQRLKCKIPTREELLKVKGIGPETADSILLYALNQPFFVIDAYTKRIMSRVGVCDEKVCKYEELQVMFTKSLPKNIKLFNEYHALLVELAKRHCTKKNPGCDNCPIREECKKIF